MHPESGVAASETASVGEPPVIVIACHAWFHEQIGGSFKIATELAEYLAARGCRVCYVCGTPERIPRNPTHHRGVELWRYPFPQARSPHPANLVTHVRGTFRLVQQLGRRSRIVCINGHTPLQFLGASLAVGSPGARQVYSVHSPFDAELRSHWQDGSASIPRRMAVQVARLIERFNCRRASQVQCDSRFTADLLRELNPSRVASKIVVAPGWVDLENFHPVDDVDAVRRRLGPAWQTPAPVFFTVRRLEPRMGLDSLVEAAKLLREQELRFRVIIGGSGSAEESLRRQILGEGLQDLVLLAGRISDEHLPLCFAAADCFVLPTRALECFGLIVLESFACGTPVIGTPVGAIPELVSKQGAGWLAADASGRAIADRMAAFLRQDLRWDRASLRRFAEPWAADRRLDQMHQLLLPATPS